MLDLPLLPFGLLNRSFKPFTVLFIKMKPICCESYQSFFTPLDPFRLL